MAGRIDLAVPPQVFVNWNVIAHSPSGPLPPRKKTQVRRVRPLHGKIFHANIIRMSGMRNSGRGPRAFYLGAAVFLLAALIRGLYLYESSDNPTFFAPIVDSHRYDEIACWLAKGEGVTDEFFWQPFFYPVFLSLLYGSAISLSSGQRSSK